MLVFAHTHSNPKKKKNLYVNEKKKNANRKKKNPSILNEISNKQNKNILNYSKTVGQHIYIYEKILNLNFRIFFSLSFIFLRRSVCQIEFFFAIYSSLSSPLLFSAMSPTLKIPPHSTFDPKHRRTKKKKNSKWRKTKT